MGNDAQAAPRLFVGALAPGRLTVAGGEAHHAARVLRLRAGDAVELFDGRGQAVAGRIETVGRRELTVAIDEPPRAQPRPSPEIELAFAVPKGKRVDWLLEKATELVVGVLQPIVSARSVAGPGAEGMSVSKRERWRSHCIAACKQCGLNWLPELAEPAELGAYLAARRAADDGSEVRVLGEARAAPIRDVLSAASPGRRVILLVGPEGGFTDDERHTATDAGFRSARLGGTTLRVETAAVALIAAVRAVYGG